MTKRDVVKWLESKQHEAIKNAEQQYEEAMKIHKEKLYAEIELEKISDQVEGYLEAACKAYGEWEQKHGDTVEIINYYASGVGGTIRVLLNRNGGIYENMKASDIRDNTPEREQLLKKINTMRHEINRNYNNLILNVKNMKNAKLACNYLKDIGFDVLDIETKEDVCTSLVTNIDTTYLFIQPAEVTEE